MDRHGGTSQFREVSTLGHGNGGGDGGRFSSSTQGRPPSQSSSQANLPVALPPLPVSGEVPGDRRPTSLPGGLTAPTVQHDGGSHSAVSSGVFVPPQQQASFQRGMASGVFSYQESQDIGSRGRDPLVGGTFNLRETAFGVSHPRSSVLSENVAFPPFTQWSPNTYTCLAPNSRGGGAGGVSSLYGGGGRSPRSPTTSHIQTHHHHQPPYQYSSGFPAPLRPCRGRPSPFPYVGGGDVRGANRAPALETRHAYPSHMFRGRTDGGALLCPPAGWRSDSEEIRGIPQAASFRYPSIQSSLTPSLVPPPPPSSSFRRVSDMCSSRRPQQERYFGPPRRPYTAGGVVSPDIRGSFFCKPSSPSSFLGLSRGDTFPSVSPSAAGVLDPPTALLPLLFPSPPHSRNQIGYESSMSLLGDPTLLDSASGSGGERRASQGGEGGRGEGFPSSLPFSEVSSCVSSLGSEVISLLQETRDLSSSPTDSSRSQRRDLPSPSAIDKDQDRRVWLSQEKADKRGRAGRVKSPVNDRNTRDRRGGRREEQGLLSLPVKEEINSSHSRQTHDVADSSSRLSGNDENAAGVEESFSYFSSFPSRSKSDRSRGISVQITPSLSMAVDVVTRVDIAAGGRTPGAPFTRHSWSVPPPNIRRRRRRRAGRLGRQAGWKVACGEFYGMEEEEESVEELREDRRECVVGLSEFWSQISESRSFGRLDAPSHPSSFSLPSAFSSQGGSTREGRAVLSATASAGHLSQAVPVKDSVSLQQQEQPFFQGSPPQPYGQQGPQPPQQTPLVLSSPRQQIVLSGRQDHTRYAEAPVPPEGLFSYFGSQHQQNHYQGTPNQSSFYLRTGAGHSSALPAQSLLQQHPGGAHSAVQAHRISRGEAVQQPTALSQPCQFPACREDHTNSSPLNQHSQQPRQGDGGDGGERFPSEDVNVPR